MKLPPIIERQPLNGLTKQQLAAKVIELNRIYATSPLDVMFHDGDAIIFADWHNFTGYDNHAFRFRQIIRAMRLSGYPKIQQW